MSNLFQGNLRKMIGEYDESSKEVIYFLNLDDKKVLNLNDLVGEEISIYFSGDIYCIATGKKIRKTYGQGYSYQAFISLARADLCILKPELCHYHKGTCREPDWGERNCFIKHSLYLSKTSGIKVGITRSHHKITRWIDQGASSAQVIAEFDSRLQVGKAEAQMRLFMPDKTNWRKNLANELADGEISDYRSEVISRVGELFFL